MPCDLTLHLPPDLCFLSILAFWGCPAIAIQLCAAVMKHMDFNNRKLHDAYESFAGLKAITRQFLILGYSCCAFDILDHPTLAFTTPVGFALSIASALPMKPGGFFQAGPTCSSMIFLCTKQTGRTWATPDGNPNCPSAVNGDTIHARMVILLYPDTR